MLSFVFPGKRAINRIKEEKERERKQRTDREGGGRERSKIDPRSLCVLRRNLDSGSSEYYVSRLFHLTTLVSGDGSGCYRD